jgi:hypothetical protein
MDSNQINDELGKIGFWGEGFDVFRGHMRYLGGIAEIDEIINNDEIDGDITVSYMSTRPHGLEMILYHENGITEFESRSTVGIFNNQIKYWTIDKQDEIIAKKSKSVLGRALVGGLILGPLGAVVGGISGIGDKKVKVSKTDNIFILCCSENDQDTNILFSCDNKKVDKTLEFFNKNYGNNYKNPAEVKELESNNSYGTNFSISDEIRKLKSLFDEGILSQDEFDQQKNKLLNK